MDLGPFLFKRNLQMFVKRSYLFSYISGILPIKNLLRVRLGLLYHIMYITDKTNDNPLHNII